MSEKCLGFKGEAVLADFFPSESLGAALTHLNLKKIKLGVVIVPVVHFSLETAANYKHASILITDTFGQVVAISFFLLIQPSSDQPGFPFICYEFPSMAISLEHKDSLQHCQEKKSQTPRVDLLSRGSDLLFVMTAVNQHWPTDCLSTVKPLMDRKVSLVSQLSVNA